MSRNRPTTELVNTIRSAGLPYTSTTLAGLRLEHARHLLSSPYTDQHDLRVSVALGMDQMTSVQLQEMLK